MFTKIGTISVGVTDQDKALDFYVNKLGFEKIDDQPMSETERWLEVAPPGAQTHIMLGLRGQSGGDKTGFTGFVLHTDNIEETCATLKARGVNISQELSTEPWGKWAQFTDPDGNEFGIWAPAWYICNATLHPKSTRQIERVPTCLTLRLMPQSISAF